MDSLDIYRLSSWIPPKYKKVTRSVNTYKSSETLLSDEISRLLSRHNEMTDIQMQRITRDLIDFCLRRFHQYAIKQRIGAHYIQKDIEGASVFEHLIPASTIRDLLLSGTLSIRHALNAPTVLISTSNDKKLRDSGLASITEDIWHPFRRYQQAGIAAQFITFTGKDLNDIGRWTLEDHYIQAFMTS